MRNTIINGYKYSMSDFSINISTNNLNEGNRRHIGPWTYMSYRYIHVNIMNKNKMAGDYMLSKANKINYKRILLIEMEICWIYLTV